MRRDHSNVKATKYYMLTRVAAGGGAHHGRGVPRRLAAGTRGSRPTGHHSQYAPDPGVPHQPARGSFD